MEYLFWFFLSFPAPKIPSLLLSMLVISCIFSSSWKMILLLLSHILLYWPFLNFLKIGVSVTSIWSWIAWYSSKIAVGSYLSTTSLKSTCLAKLSRKESFSLLDSNKLIWKLAHRARSSILILSESSTSLPVLDKDIFLPASFTFIYEGIDLPAECKDKTPFKSFASKDLLLISCSDIVILRNVSFWYSVSFLSVLAKSIFFINWNFSFNSFNILNEFLLKTII